jgi:hypothetical protein
MAEMTTETPLWLRFNELHGRRAQQEFVVENALNLPSQVVDRRGLLLGTAEGLSNAPARTMDWLAHAMKMHGQDHWKQLRKGCAELTESFFSGRGNAATWVSFETCRDPISIQSPSLRNLPWDTQWDLPLANGKPGQYLFSSVDRSVCNVAFNRESLLFINQEQQHSRKIARFARTRSILTENGLLSALFDGWCAADPIDDAELIEKGLVPASLPLRRENAVSFSRFINWYALDAHGVIDAFSIELHHETAEIISIRRAKIPFELVLKMHPRQYGWFAHILNIAPPDLASLEIDLDERTFRNLQRLVTDKSGKANGYRRLLEVLLRFVETGSLRQAGIIAHAGSTKDVRRHLQSLERELNVSLLTTSTNKAGRRNSSIASPVAIAIGKWIRDKSDLCRET